MTRWTEVDGHQGMWVRFRSDRKTGRRIVCGLRIEGAAITAEQLRRIPLSRIEAAANLGDTSAVDDLPPLTRPDGSDSPAFSKLVAEHYRAWSRLTPHPGARMAAAAGVPVATVHGWIRLARLRGELPTGSRGKAG